MLWKVVETFMGRQVFPLGPRDRHQAGVPDDVWGVAVSPARPGHLTRKGERARPSLWMKMSDN